ncbi:MAG: hypothetical protein CMO01_15660 [Thalassobius sp.]|nr:hypothetical protein [Thalassovita sp.]
MITELNNQLKTKLHAELEVVILKVNALSNSPFTPIREAFELAKKFDLIEFERKTKARLEDIIPTWLEIQAKEDKIYDSIYFEYSDQEIPPYEAFSYGLFDMRNYKLTIEKNYYQFAQQGEWDAGAGFELQPYSFCKPFHIAVLRDRELYDKIHYDNTSGIYDLFELASAQCKVVFNSVFSNADNKGMFDSLRIKKGGLFMYDSHDGGNVQDPFYLKS